MGWTTAALADCPGIYAGESCNVLANQVAGSNYVCRDCDSGGNEYVCCYGPNWSATPDLLVLIEDGSGDPYAYGKLDRNAGSPTLFCCDGTDMGTTEAVEVEVYMDNGGDIVCLQDAAVGS